MNNKNDFIKKRWTSAPACFLLSMQGQIHSCEVHIEHIYSTRKKRMFKVLSVNTQTAECVCCISVICSFFSVQHLDGLNKTSISTILSNVLNVFSQNFSREFCALFSHKYWNFHICVNIFYIFSCILNSSLCVNSSCILNYSYCVRFCCIFYQTFLQ